jgi:hypothetical protein
MKAENAFAAWDLELVGLDQFRRLGPEHASGASEPALNGEQLRYLLCFSLLAPSTHNSVPQAYALDSERSAVDLFLDREHVLAASDPTGRQALISIGCALENLTRAAEQYGVQSRWTADAALAWPRRGSPAGSRFLRVGRVELSPTAVAPGDAMRRSVLGTLLERKVVRAEFDPGVPLPEELLSALRAAVAELRDLELSLATLPADRFAWGKLDELALKHELEVSEFRRELGGFILDNDDVTTVRGMRGRELGLDDQSARAFSRELRGESTLASEKLAFLARAERAALTSSSAVVALSARADTAPCAVEIGRAYQRCALIAWQHAFAHAIHAAIVEVSHVRAICGATLLSGRGLPSLVFRLGRPVRSSDWKRPHSSRPPLDSLILPAAAAGRTTFG